MFLILLLLISTNSAFGRRPFRPEEGTKEIKKVQADPVVLPIQTVEKILDASKEDFKDELEISEKDNEQEVSFGAFSYYDEDEEDPIGNLEKATSRPVSSSWPWSKFTQNTKPENDEKIENNENNENTFDDDTETMSYEVLEKRFNYEVRAYKKSKWVCTEKVESLDEDPYINWQSKFNDGFEAMREMKKDKERKKTSMFWHLYKYILGVNSEATEIDMTRPVVTKHTKLARNRDRREMCFWLGSYWENRTPPEPLKKEVYIMEIPDIKVYVRKFSGWALAYKDWTDELEQLENDLSNQVDVDDSGVFYTAGYQGPWTPENERRNEVWLLKTENNPSNSESSWANKQSTKIVSSDDDTEMISHELLRKTRDYELRRYPASKWACTKEYNIDPLNDPMRGWMEKYGDNPMQVMSDSKWDESTSNKMFMRLFRYILGVNSETEEIKMTRPVTTQISPLIRTRTIDEEMCFWLGTPYETKDAPKPIDKKITIVNRPEMVVYVQEFNGFAFSHQDWQVEYEKLKDVLKDEIRETFDQDIWYHIGYDSPFTPAEQRRNEVWIPQV